MIPRYPIACQARSPKHQSTHIPNKPTNLNQPKTTPIKVKLGVALFWTEMGLNWRKQHEPVNRVSTMEATQVMGTSTALTVAYPKIAKKASKQQMLGRYHWQCRPRELVASAVQVETHNNCMRLKLSTVFITAENSEQRLPRTS